MKENLLSILKDKIMGLKLVGARRVGNLVYEFWESNSRFELRGYKNGRTLTPIKGRKYIRFPDFTKISVCDPKRFIEHFKTEEFKKYESNRDRPIHHSQNQHQATTLT